MWWAIGGMIIVLVLVWLACHPSSPRLSVTTKRQ
jgi:hypothetical protein